MKPCLDCGIPIEQGSRCMNHQTKFAAQYEVKRTRQRNTTALGYDGAWKKLSVRARRIQPWCSDCGAEDRLTVDHLPSAWWRRNHGLPIRLSDVDVVCSGCNSDRGSSRPGSERYRAWLRDRGGRGDRHEDRALGLRHRDSLY